MKRKEEMTKHERMLRNLIVGIRNDYIGGLENMTYDYDEDQLKEMGVHFPTRDEVVEYIYNEIMNGKEQIVHCPNDIWGMEKKHIRFLGEQFVRELIEDRVDYDINKNGWVWL
jgi:hypothetical protein